MRITDESEIEGFKEKVIVLLQGSAEQTCDFGLIKKKLSTLFTFTTHELDCVLNQLARDGIIEFVHIQVRTKGWFGKIKMKPFYFTIVRMRSRL